MLHNKKRGKIQLKYSLLSKIPEDSNIGNTTKAIRQLAGISARQIFTSAILATGLDNFLKLTKNSKQQKHTHISREF